MRKIHRMFLHNIEDTSVAEGTIRSIEMLTSSPAAGTVCDFFNLTTDCIEGGYLLDRILQLNTISEDNVRNIVRTIC